LGALNARAAFQVCAAATCPAAPAADCKRWTAEVEADLPTIRLTANDARGAPVANLRVSSCGHACTQSQADSLHAKALIPDIALLTSAAAFGAAAWIYFGRDTHRSTTALSFQPHPDGAALSLRIAF